MINLEALFRWSISKMAFYERVSPFHFFVTQLNKNFRVGDKIASCYTRKKYEIMELGLMHPEEVPMSSLNPGQVGYIACNMKQSTEGNSKFLCPY